MSEDVCSACGRADCPDWQWLKEHQRKPWDGNHFPGQALTFDKSLGSMRNMDRFDLHENEMAKASHGWIKAPTEKGPWWAIERGEDARG